MTIDPIERVVYEVLTSPGIYECADIPIIEAELIAKNLRAWFTEQGIPIDKLLSGEYVAVPKDPDWSQERLSATDSKKWSLTGPVGPSKC